MATTGATGQRTIPDHPDKSLRYRRPINLLASARDVWVAREMLRSLVERELRARYKQTYLSWAWALITPVSLMVAFTVFVDRVAEVDTAGAPYVLFSYLGLLPWTFFSTSLTQGSTSLLVNKSLLNKIFCPRELFPASAVSISAADTLIASTALVILFATTGFTPRATSLWFPVLIVLQLLLALAVAMISSIIVVYLRDVRQALSLVLQFGLFATPVAYGLDAIPEKWLKLYCFLNPLAAIIDSYRRTVLYGQAPDWTLLGLSTAGTLTLLLGGYWLFKRLETGIADLA